jgi:hypothetical protein
MLYLYAPYYRAGDLFPQGVSLCRLNVAPDLKSYCKGNTLFAIFQILQPTKRKKMTEK